jgi:hypothetical protein
MGINNGAVKTKFANSCSPIVGGNFNTNISQYTIINAGDTVLVTADGPYITGIFDGTGSSMSFQLISPFT